MSETEDSRFKYFIRATLFVAVFSVLSALVTYFYEQLQLEGAFVRYQTISKPQPEIENIVTVFDEGVIVKTKDGYYVGKLEKCFSDGRNECWSVFLEDIPDENVENHEQGCLIKYRVEPVPPMDYSCCGPGSGYDRYALLSDGEIWVWHIGPHSDLAPLAPYFVALYGLMIGFCIGLFLVIFYPVVVWVKRKFF